MRTTSTSDDDLLSRAQELTGITEKSALVREASKALVAKQSGQRLALLGGKRTRRTTDPAATLR